MRRRRDRGTVLEVVRATGALIAVIEDDQSCRTALGRLLRAEGFETALFASAEAFFEHPLSPAPTCVIVDVHLPGMSGIDLQHRLRAHHRTLPVIVVTGNRAREIRERAERNGCIGFFWKPVDGDTLIAMVNAIPAQPGA